MNFDKQIFLNSFDCILQSTYATDCNNASLKQLYNAVSKAVMSNICSDWNNISRHDGKRCGYISAEFLIGRSIYSNLLNLGILDDVKDALALRGIDINMFEEVEDEALGNGGLGRLAACYLESGATCDIPLDGYGLRYRYGLFKQSFIDGFQREEGDDWQKWGDPWGIRREEDAVTVEFNDFSVKAVPYDMPVIGYGNGVINNLRLWQSEPIECFDFKSFDSMEGGKIADSNFQATQITDVLYPNDNTDEGKLLRLRQQYFMVSATVQDIMKKHLKKGLSPKDLDKSIVLQLNDTHPVLAICELIRLLQKLNVSFNDSMETVARVFNFTNHTIMGEALEKWQGKMVKKIIPAIWTIIEKIQKHLEVQKLGDPDKYFVVKNDVVHMANLAIYACAKVNGVANIHSEILKNQTFKDWYDVYPEKFTNVTNGITPRRWFLLNNRNMAEEVTKRIGTDWHTDLTQISKLKQFVNDKAFRDSFVRIKRENKQKLVDYIRENEGIELSADFVFDVQIKRLHEYKRQLMNALSILYIYNELKAGNLTDFKPTAFIFGAKSAPGYYAAKAIIKFINEIAKLVNNDPDVADKMKVVFVQNYNVSYAEKLVCASDISEQISMAGMEASGTGNMKFMLNGTVTLGTMDGANVEICEEAGTENNYIFGATVDEVAEVKKSYKPLQILAKNKKIAAVVNTLKDGTFDDADTGVLRAVYDSLTKGDNSDYYLVLHDFENYIDTKLQLIRDYGSEEFITKCLLNMSGAGKFSSDRAVREYAKEIWRL